MARVNNVMEPHSKWRMKYTFLDGKCVNQSDLTGMQQVK